MTREEKQEWEGFSAALRDSAARVTEFVGEVTQGMSRRQRDEVVEEAYVAAWKLRSEFDPKADTFATWYGRLMREVRVYLKTVRPEVAASKPRCQCFGRGPCEFALCERVADYAPGKGILDMLSESVAAEKT